MTSTVPSFNLTRQNGMLREELVEAFDGLLERGMFVLGENVKALEQEIAAYCGAACGIGVASGSDALYLALAAGGVGPGDEVITTPFTFYATAGSIIRAGARPVFADIDPETWNIDPAAVEEKVTPRTRAVIPVHLYGCPAEMDPLAAAARKHNFLVIEDAAQSIGAVYKGKKAGSIGDAACLSFFPTKNLGAFGDAGMVLTGSPDIAERVRLLRVHGAEKKYHHRLDGCNSRLDELQAAMLLVKLRHLERWNERRREIAALYGALLADAAAGGALRLPVEPPYAFHVYHQYTIQTPLREELQEALRRQGIGSTVYYPLPMHRQKALASLGYREGDFPVAEAACREVLSLPMFPELTDAEVGRVAGALNSFFENI